MQQVTTKDVISFIARVTRPYYWAALVLLVVNVVWAVDISLRPYVLKVILNRLSENPASEVFAYLATPVLIYFLMTLLMTLTFRFYNYFIEIKVIPALRQKIVDSIFGHLLSHSHRYYQNNFAGSLTNKVNDLASSIPDIIQIVSDRFFSHSLALVIAIFTLGQVSFKYALAMGIWAAGFGCVAMLFAKRLGQESDRWSELISEITGKIVDILSNILSVRLFSRGRFEERVIHDAMGESVRAERKLQTSYFYIWLGYGLSYATMMGINLYLLMLDRQRNAVTVGDFALIITINSAITGFFWELTKDFSQFSKLYGKITQALRITTAPHDIVDAPGAKNLKVTQGTIVFEEVGFAYGSEPLFEHKSVSIPAGQKVGLVGYSGGGKTTFVSLILRLFDVSQGRILIDGQDIRQVTQDSLHEAIGMIPQDPSLFHKSLADNIRYGLPGASDEEVALAASRAHAHEFISELPQGYQSLVGERGVKLSGGQRQRIAIARAMLKNAPILILDEATSQLDSVTEQQIQESLWQLMQGKTTIVIAHRLSTLLHMDRILVFDRGRIVEEGTHEQLLAQHGLYKTLWDAQVGGFLPA